jgi:hypothetical protein
MKPTYLGENGLAGSLVVYFSLTNTESATCHTYGWPKIEFLSAAGAVLSPQRIENSTKDPLGLTPLTIIDLKPGQQAFFRIIASEESSTSDGRDCADATKLELTVPYDTLAQDVAVPGVPACGVVTVSPLLPRYIADA